MPQFRSGTNENVHGNTTATATAPQLHGEMYVCIIALHRMVYGLRYLPKWMGGDDGISYNSIR